jgi:WD40 repeat protein/predicted Ser/Thr protein kinase
MGSSSSAKPPPSGGKPGPARRYTVLGELARGGLGQVLVATDEDLGRTVAIKQPIAPTPEARARFEREARLTARLQHSGVVPVYEAGQWEDGQPFFAMKMVEGRSLAELIAQAGSFEERLTLLGRVLVVVETLAYAHSRGVIHRDLKPANVVVSDYGETVIIDWGLARAVRDPEDLEGEEDLTEIVEGEHGLTEAGRVLGTPQFMPPEQAAGGVVDERADVYAVGAMVYNVLTGEPPFAAAPTSRLLAAVRERSPVPLLTRAPQAPPDLVAVVEKAMAHDPAARYANAAELAEDLRRFLDGHLVEAHRYPASALVARWLRRHRAAVVVAVVLLAALAASGTMAVQRILVERNAAIEARQALEIRRNGMVLLHAQRSLETEPTAALAWLKQYRPDPEQAWLARAVADEAAARGAARHVFEFDRPSPAAAVSPLAPWMAVGGNDGTVRLYDLDTGSSKVLGRHQAAIGDLAFSPASRTLASLDVKGQLRLWAPDGRVQSEATLGGRPGVVRVRFSMDGRRLATTIGDDGLAVVPVEAPERGAHFRLGSAPSSFAFCPRGDALVALDFEGGAQVLDPGASQLRPLEGRHPDARLICLRDGRRFVSAGVDGLVKLWDLRAGLVRVLGQHRDWVTSLAASPDGTRVASGSGDDTVMLFDLAGGSPRVLGGHGDTVRGVLFSADGQLLVSLDFTSTVRVWDLASGEALRTFRTGARRETRLALTSDGRALVASGSEGAHVWPLSIQRPQVLRGHGDAVISLDWSPDGRRLASGGRDSVLRLWDAGGESLGQVQLDSWITTVRFLRPETVVAGTRLAQAWLFDWPGKGARRVATLGTKAAAMSPALTLSHQRDRIAFPDGDTVVLQDLTGGRLRLAAQLPAVRDISFSRGGDRVAVLSADGTVGLWNTASGQPERVRHVGHLVNQVILSDDDRWAAIRSQLNHLWLWDLKSDRLDAVPTAGPVNDLLFFARDRRALVYEGPEASIQVMDLDTRVTRALRGHRAPLQEVVLSPTAAVLASADAAGFVRLWNLETQETALFQVSPGPIERLAFSPDGKRLAAAVSDWTIRLWSVDSLLAAMRSGTLTVRTTAVVDENRGPSTPVELQAAGATRGP